MNAVSQKLLGALQSLGRTGLRARWALPEPFGEDLIESRIGIHDSTHFEIKLDYTIDPTRAANRYRVEMFVFTPLSLGITPETYGKGSFYRDIQAYIRFKTPAVEPGALLDPGNEASPLIRLERFLHAPPPGTSPGRVPRGLASDLKLLGCLVRAQVRDRVAEACAHLQVMEETGEFAEGGSLEVEALGLVRNLGQILDRFRALKPALQAPEWPTWLLETHQCVDEYLSTACENFLTRLLQELDQRGRGGHGFLRTALVTWLTDEQGYQEREGLLSLRGAEGDTSYVFRRSLLKKFVMSVLFLEITKDTDRSRFLDLFAALAAGIAMLIATLGGLWAQKRYLTSTWPFLVAIVVLYMLKDRTKEWLRTLFSRHMTRTLADWSVRIRDPERGLDVGRCREAFGFLKPDQVPREVWNLRHRQLRSSIEAAGKPETILKYEKEITLDGRVVAKAGGLLDELNDILRFDLTRFLARADDPVTAVGRYNPERDMVEEIACPKVYHLNAIFVLTADGVPRRTTLEQVRIVFDKRGIQALEQVP